MRKMTPKQAKIIFTVSIMVVLAVAAVIIGLYCDNQSVPKPFAFILSTYPNNGTVMQAQNLTIQIDATYLGGQPEPIMLSTKGGPNGTIFQFSDQTGIPTEPQPFTSNLTVSVPASAVSGVYLISVTSNASTQTINAPFNLTVLNAEIQVFGNVTMDSKVYLSGVTLDVIPTDILFTSRITGEVYQAKVHRFTDTVLAPGKTGNYSIMLPNQQSYNVDFYCLSYPHYIPVARAAIYANENGSFIVSAGIGVTSTEANFTG